MSLSRVSKKWLTTIPSDVRRSLGLDEGDFIMWEVDASKAVATVKVVKDPLKFLKGRYSDPKLRYDVVEETADKMVRGMIHADSRARPSNSSS
ncbi:MAG: AbrB/MazE/SpoVT family DNA-binding domain-containing protein [Candidatus Bathyarchaeota archaeon]